MNSNREDYLKAIYEEGGMGRCVPNKTIVEKLQVAPGSVSEMLSKLNKAGLVISIPHKGVKLTNDGLKVCFNIVRKHRLWEVFLIRHLNYSWREAHEEAHLLEHTATDKMIDRLDFFLNYPEVCPHGEQIPREGIFVENEIYTLTLNQSEVGEKVIISRIIESGELLDYLQKKGLLIGKEIEIISKGAYEGEICFLQETEKIVISHKAAAQIYIKRI